MNNIAYLIPALGVVGLIAMAIKSAWVTKQDAGEANMQELAGFIAKGAMAFLKAEWKILAYFAVIAAILLGWSGTLVDESHPLIAVSFLIGAILSAFAGYIGMRNVPGFLMGAETSALWKLAADGEPRERRGRRRALRQRGASQHVVPRHRLRPRQAEAPRHGNQAGECEEARDPQVVSHVTVHRVSFLEGAYPDCAPARAPGRAAHPPPPAC